MPNTLPVRLLWHSLNWLTRLAVVASAIAAVLAAILIIALRYWLMPNVGQYHDQIAASLSDAIGSAVEVGVIEGDWRGVHPRLHFSAVRILDDQRQSALEFPEIRSSVSWLSLITGELRLASLEIERPELLIRRDTGGNFFIGGLALSRQGGDNDLADWLLRQSHMVARDALVVWVDEQRAAPPLVLKHVNLRIENFFSRHRFALQAQPPEELSTPLDLRGDFRGESFDALNDWRGQIYTRLDYTDVTAWRPWLDLPREFSRGRGALRGWLDVEQGRVSGITADVSLSDVVTRMAVDLPELALQGVHGRVAWKDPDAGGLELSTRRLSMRLQNGIELPSTDFYLRLAGAERDEGELRANLLQLETLASLAAFVPLQADMRAWLETHAPAGRVVNLNVQWQGAQEYKVKGRFENLALNRVGAMPGFSGLSFEVDGGDSSGRLTVDARQLVVDAPDVMPEPLRFVSLTGQAGWQRKRGELRVTVDNVAVTNDDLAGNLYGSYQTQEGTLGLLDLTVALTRGDVTKAYRYTPLAALDPEDNDWLKGALLAGHTEDFRVRVKGNLSDFPLDGSEDALLEIGGHARGVVLEFDPDWPRVENIAGEFWIRGNKLEVKAPEAGMLGAQLRNLTVTLPDLASDDLPLEVKGAALAASDTFLQFIQRSPVRGYIDGFTDGMTASGDSQLALFVRVPLQGEQPAKVAGTLRMGGNDIDLGGGAPLLRNTRGQLTFTESGVQADAVQAEVLGGATRIDLKSEEGGVLHARAQGHSNLDVLARASPHPLLKQLRGGAAWDADITVVKKAVQMVIKSDLQGIASTLPAPFAKRTGEPMPLRVEKRSVADGQDMIELQLGQLLSARLMRREERGGMEVKRGVIRFGQPGDNGKWLKRDGVWLVGRLPQLSLQGWGGLLNAGADAPSLPIAGADLRVARASGFGMRIDELAIDASPRGEGIAAQLSSEVLNGEVEWQPRAEGKLTARLQNLIWNADPAQKTTPASSVAPASLPALQLGIENLLIGGKQIGRFELVGYPEGGDWRLRRLRITNPDGSLSGDGIWHGGERDARTSVNLQLDISDAGKILARSGYPGTVKGGSGKLQASLAWKGAPEDFNYATLNGALDLDTGKGQFLKMEPGIGKLLGILSLQALPKRITLDFNDVFSDGFQFDRIRGNAQIGDGVLMTQNLQLDGSSAKVTMKGNVDLNRETQDLRVRILPTLGDSVSLLGAFAAGPAVGIGALLVNKVLGDPLDKLVSFEYNVSGTWSDPKVVKLGEVPVKQDNVE